MNTVRRFADKNPFLFVAAVLVAWVLFFSLFAILAGVLFSLPIADPITQVVGGLLATILLIIGVVRLGWINEIGIVNFGSPSAWVVTLIVAIYVLLVNFYAFFDEIAFQPASIFTQAGSLLLLRALQVGFVEEVVFRGIILYGLVRIWGKSRRGLIAALAVQAFLFGSLHALQAFVGLDPVRTISNVLATIIFGLWVGALVISVGSVWPAIILHSVSNGFILIKGLTSYWVDPTYLGYLRGALFELPLVLLGLWFVWTHRSVKYLGSD